MANYIELKNITAAYGTANVLQDFSLQIERGELVALLGASGCGKTTVLKIIAGLLESDAGEVWLDGENISRVPAEKREISLVFQKPLLFPFLNVAENVGFGLKMRKTPKAVVNEKVAEVLELVRLENFAGRMPKQLSGGQEQRVALARALVTNPRVLLLDEPFSALDAGLRIEMRNLVRELQQQLKITAIFVTHDQEEAVSIADRIALIDDGSLAQIAAPKDFFSNPATPNAARFFGWRLFEGIIRPDFIETAVGNFSLGELSKKTAGDKILVGFHPARARIGALEKTNFDKNHPVVKLIKIINFGAKIRLTASLANGEILETEIFDAAVIDFPVNAERGTLLKLFIPPQTLINFSLNGLN